VVIAGTLGVGSDADVAVLVLSFPDLLTTVLVGGAVSAILIPDFKAAQAAGGARRLFFAMSASIGVAALAVAGVTAMLSAPIVRLFGPGIAADAAGRAAPLFALAALVFPLTSLAAVSTGYLQSRGRFAVPAAGTLVFNLALVVAVALLVRPAELVWVALGAVAGAALRWLSQVVAALRVPDPAGVARLNLASLARRYPQALGATSVIVLVPFISRTLASLGAPGDVASLTYALRIVDFPLGAFLTVAAVAALPHLSELAVAGRRDEATRLLGELLRLTAALTIPVTIALVCVATPVAALLFGRGAVDPSATERIGGVAAIALLSLPAQSANATFTAVYVAERRLGAAFAINSTALALFLASAWLAGSALGVRGIAIAYAAVHWGLALAYVVELRRARGLRITSGLLRELGVAAVAGGAVVAPFAAVALAITLPPLAAVALVSLGAAIAILIGMRIAFHGPVTGPLG
jgi:putative peptidoglycan lipid II flippase